MRVQDCSHLEHCIGKLTAAYQSLPELFSHRVKCRASCCDQSCFSGGGLDSWAGLTSALELLQWKSDIPDTDQLWHPLCATLRFLLTQLATGSGAGDTEMEDDEQDRPATADNSSRW